MGSQNFACKIMDLIDPHQNIFNGVLSRKHCLKTHNGLFIKDLRIIINKNQNNILIIDKNVHSFAFQIDNGIPLLPWDNDPNDLELNYLTKYLLNIGPQKNLKTINRNFFRLYEMLNIDIKELIRT